MRENNGEIMEALLSFATHTRLVMQVYIANFALCVFAFWFVTKETFWDSLWWIITIWFTTGYGMLESHLTGGRIVISYTLISSHILALLFAANFIAKLTRYKEHRKVHGSTRKKDVTAAPKHKPKAYETIEF